MKTRILPAQTGVGYGLSYRTTASLALATISLGYADGWHRRAAGTAYFHGVGLPFVGRVSMDSIILDISALEPGSLKSGDLVDLMDEIHTVDDVAGQAGTIGYEMLTSLGRRFHRRYAGG